MTKKLLFTMVLLAVSFFGYSQTAAGKERPKDTIPREIRYAKLKQLYIKYLDSKTYQTVDSLFQVFAHKLTPYQSLQQIKEQNPSYIDWAKANIYITEFENTAEAEKLWNEYETSIQADTNQNKEYFDYLLETIQLEGGVDLHMKVITDVREEYPEKHKSLTFPKRRQKDFNPPLPSLPGN